jgi:predicted Zn-dependent protease
MSLPPDQLYKQYRAEVERRLHADPQDAAVSVRYLKVLLGEQRTAEAKDAAARLLALEPPAVLAAEAGRALLESQLFSDAETLLAYAASSNSAASIQVDLAIALFHTRGSAAGLERLDRVPEAERSGDYYLARAAMLDADGKSGEAVASVQRAISAGSSRPDLYEAAARLLVRAGRRDDAARLFTEAARALPDNASILLMQAAILAYAGRAGEAERALLQLENRWPEWAPAYATNGILLQMQKRSREAVVLLETAVALGSSDPNVHYYLAEALLDTAPKRIDDAQKALDAALSAWPDDARMLTLAGRIDCLRREFARAVEHLVAATHANPNDLSARLLLIEAYTRLGRKDDAARESEQADHLKQLHSASEDRGMEQLLRQHSR